jgi:hypothetical protein
VTDQGQRKIAAILADDVVGYSRLVGADDDRTLARLRALRSDLIDPTIAVHHGRIVKRTYVSTSARSMSVQAHLHREHPFGVQSGHDCPVVTMGEHQELR